MNNTNEYLNYINYYIDIPEGVLISNSDYEFSLNVTNFQGIVSTGITKKIRVSEKFLIRPHFEGLKDGIIQISEDLIIRTIPRLFLCDGYTYNTSDIETVYFLSATSSQFDISSMVDKNAERILHIPPFTLTPGLTYEIHVNFAFESLNEFIGTQSFTIVAAHSDLKAVISPISQLLSEGLPLIINGSDSYDRILFITYSR